MSAASYIRPPRLSLILCSDVTILILQAAGETDCLLGLPVLDPQTCRAGSILEREMSPVGIIATSTTTSLFMLPVDQRPKEDVAFFRL